MLRTGRRKVKDSIRIWRAPIDRTEVCPICGERSSKVFKFGPPDFVTGPSASIPEIKNSTKYRCRRCNHLYSHWLSNDLVKTAKIYSGIYAEDQPNGSNLRSLEEQALLQYIVMILGSPARARLLDFGCGPNAAATYQLRAEGHDAQCCDILDKYNYDGEIFFQYDHEPGTRRDYFDGIISVETVEHLSDTVETWTYFNRVLRQGGLMAHSFPSQHYYGLDHSDVMNPFHICLFSARSLKLLAEQTGFKLRGVENIDEIGRKVFLFEKVKQI